jgi:type III secretion protein R
MLLASMPVLAQTPVDDQIQTPPLYAQMGVLVFLSLLPFVVMLLTSFTKIVVVLGLLRNALGVQQAPPNMVINGIAILLSVYVMFPTGMTIYERSKSVLEQELPKNVFSAASADVIIQVVQAGREPLREFLVKNTRAKHERSFFRLAYKFFPEEVREKLKPTDFIIMVPAYITSQVEDAFQIGVLIYLPFFVIDLVTSNILLAMGMMMLSPMTIALPLKLLLLVMLDGWALLVQGLVLTFRP